MNPSGSRAYVTNLFSSTVSVINTATNAVIATVPVGIGPVGVAVAPNGGRVYVTNSFSKYGVGDQHRNERVGSDDQRW
jgi:YVTN family beta-propeller protein